MSTVGIGPLVHPSRFAVTTKIQQHMAQHMPSTLIDGLLTPNLIDHSPASPTQRLSQLIVQPIGISKIDQLKTLTNHS